jgi:hypothetical protein
VLAEEAAVDGVLGIVVDFEFAVLDDSLIEAVRFGQRAGQFELAVGQGLGASRNADAVRADRHRAHFEDKRAVDAAGERDENRAQLAEPVRHQVEGALQFGRGELSGAVTPSSTSLEGSTREGANGESIRGEPRGTQGGSDASPEGIRRLNPRLRTRDSPISCRVPGLPCRLNRNMPQSV